MELQEEQRLWNWHLALSGLQPTGCIMTLDETFKLPHDKYLHCVSLISQDREAIHLWEHSSLLPFSTCPPLSATQTGWKSAPIFALSLGKNEALLTSCLSTPWHLPVMESSPLHPLRGSLPLDPEETTSFHCSTSPLNFSVVPTHSPSCNMPSAKFHSNSYLNLILPFFFFLVQWGRRGT